MKLPKTTKRYCPYCKKHTEQKISLLSTGQKRPKTKHGSMERARKRGLGRGMGNRGKWGSKPATSKWKRKTKSTTKKVFLYTCNVCKKSKQSKKGIRVSRAQLEAKEEKQKSQGKEKIGENK